MSIFKVKNHFTLLKYAVLLTTVFYCVLLLFPMLCHAEDGGTVELVFSRKLYHKHTGTEGVYGGCYTKAETTEETVEKECGGTMVYLPDLGTTVCNRCGASYTGDQSGRGCWTVKYETVEETTYVLGCGMSESTSLGTLTVTKSTNEWTRAVILRASYKVNSKVNVKAKPYIWNGAAATDNAELEVRENGTYTLRLNAGSNVNTKKGTVSVPVTNIDVTGPVISSYGQEPVTEWTKAGVQIYNIEAQDLQPDQSNGCGLNELPFSYDGGMTWTAESMHSYTENGAYEIQVRDKLSNISSQNIVVSNIDRTPPEARTEYVSEPNQSAVTITIEADDIQPDGTAGCGLHEQAYSYDGGNSWREEAVYTVSKNRVVEIAVRDKLGNAVSLKETIGNIDSYGPKLKYTIEPDTWTRDNVTVYLEAADINADGSTGVGLPEKWYSLDEGTSWKTEKELEVSENQTLVVILRDIYNNQTKEQIVIDHIDRQAPKVSLQSRELTIGDSKRVELIVKAKDAQSGLEKKAYSWDGGSTYSDQPSMVVSENGSYRVRVRDKAGNIGNASIQVDCFPERDDEPEEEEEPVKSEEEPPESTEEPEPQEEQTETAEGTEPEAESESTEETESETVLVTLEELGDEPERVIQQEIREEKQFDVGRWIAILLLASAVLFLALLLLAAWLRTIAVYVKNRSGEWCYLGRLWISLKEERYVVNIPEAMMEKCETTYFCFKPAWGFACLHEDKEMYFNFPENICISDKICEKMKLSLF